MILMFLVFVAVNMRTNIGIAMVCMVNSTAYTTHKYDNTSGSIVPRNPECQKVESADEIEDLGYHVILIEIKMPSGAKCSTSITRPRVNWQKIE